MGGTHRQPAHNGTFTKHKTQLCIFSDCDNDTSDTHILY